MALKCDNHPDKDAWNCSGWAVKRYLCEECRAAMKPSLPSPREYARAGNQIWESFGGRSGIADHAYHNPNAVYARAQASNKDITNDN